MAPCLEVSDQLCILDALLLGKEAPVPIGRQSAWTPVPCMDAVKTRHTSCHCRSESVLKSIA